VTPEAVAARLRASGQRVTRQRLAVFEALAALSGHRGVDEIAASLHERGERLPTTSVYNAVEALTAADLVTVAHRGPPRALYEVAGRGHDHFVCRTCGRILDVDPPRSRPRPPTLPGVVIDEVETTYRGLCADCAVILAPADGEGDG
jgi:Fur family ferric uptake transcriptional regulator